MDGLPWPVSGKFEGTLAVRAFHPVREINQIVCIWIEQTAASQHRLPV
jgi:hypothetical protein